MIISASRRTDIPALYAEWFMNRVRVGFCEVPNPFNPRQVSRVSLEPEDVDGFVFWTRNPAPMLGHLDELRQRGYPFYFLVTLLNYPRSIEPKTPTIDQAIKSFQALSAQIGPERVVWRYDPILFTGQVTASYHREQFARLAGELNGQTDEVKVSLVDLYRKNKGRLKQLTCLEPGEMKKLLRFMADCAREHGMTMTSCAEEMDMTACGINSGKCIDDDRIQRAWGIEISAQKDPSQRNLCCCVQSRDIGMYDSCTMGCAYCYAVSSFEKARENRREHNPLATALVGRRLSTSV